MMINDICFRHPNQCGRDLKQDGTFIPFGEKFIKNTFKMANIFQEHIFKSAL